MTTQLTVSYEVARQRARQLLLSFPGEWQSILPSSEDESSSKIFTIRSLHVLKIFLKESS